MIGRITRVLSNDYTVRYDDGNEDIDNSGSWNIYNPFGEDNRYIADFN